MILQRLLTSRSSIIRLRNSTYYVRCQPTVAQESRRIDITLFAAINTLTRFINQRFSYYVVTQVAVYSIQIIIYYYGPIIQPVFKTLRVGAYCKIQQWRVMPLPCPAMRPAMLTQQTQLHGLLCAIVTAYSQVLCPHN